MKPMTTGPPIQCSISIKDAPEEKVLFESFPHSISEGYSARFESRNARTPVDTYVYWMGGDYTSFSLTLKFVAGLNQFLARTKSTFDEVYYQVVKQPIETYLNVLEEKVRWLQALTFPRPAIPRGSSIDKRISIEGEPPRVLVTLGKFMTIEGVVLSTDVTWGPVFHPQTVRPYSAEVALSIKRLGTFYPDWWDISAPLPKLYPPSNTPPEQQTANVLSQGQQVKQTQYSGTFGEFFEESAFDSNAAEQEEESSAFQWFGDSEED